MDVLGWMGGDGMGWMGGWMATKRMSKLVFRIIDSKTGAEDYNRNEKMRVIRPIIRKDFYDKAQE